MADADLTSQLTTDPGKVAVLDPYGNLGTMDKGEADQAIANSGFRLAGQQDIQNYLDSQKYGKGTPSALKATALGAARTATFGLSDLALTKSGAMTPEEIRAYQKYRPGYTALGEFGAIPVALSAPELLGGSAAAGEAATEGAGVLSKLANPVKAVAEAGQATSSAALPITEKLASLAVNPETSPVIHKILAQTGATAVGSAVEGAAYGLGQAISEYALGNPDLTGEKMLANTGLMIGESALLGAGIGGTLGLGIESAKAALPKLFKPEPTSKVAQQVVKSAETPDAAAKQAGYAAQIAQDAQEVRPPSSAGSGIGPAMSIDELSQRVKEAKIQEQLKYMPLEELPSKQLLSDAEAIIGGESQFPVQKFQYESLSNQRARDVYSAFKEGGTVGGQALRDLESLQKREGVRKINESVKAISPQSEITSDPVKAGNKLINAFVDQYEAEKKDLSPMFQRFDDASIAEIDDRVGIINRLEKAVPDSAQYLNMSKNGVLELSPYKPTMSLGKEAYGAIKDLVGAINEKGLTVGELRNVRESMRDRINWLSAPRDASQISSIRKNLMDMIEAKVQELSPDLQVRDAFKRYAINEEQRSIIEKIFGGSISDRASFAKTIKPEDILDRIFSNTVSTNAAKQILGSKFDEALANYLAHNVDKVTDLAKNGFSSNKFASFLRRKAPELGAAMAERQDLFKKINAWTDKMRILPDAPSSNPSGTAKTLSILGLASKLGHFQLGEAYHEVAGYFKEGAEQARLKNVLDHIQAGKPIEDAEHAAEKHMVKTTVLGKIERMKQNIEGAILKSANGIFKASDQYLMPFSGKEASKEAVPERKKKLQDVTAMINQLHNDPSGFVQKLEASTRPLYAVAPNITGGMHMAATRAVSFLASKAPQEQVNSPLSAKPTISDAEVRQFRRYIDAVEDPVSVMKQIGQGTLTKEAIETLHSVYPGLYEEMQTQIMHQLTDKIAKEGPASIPYRVKLGLSLFMQQDLDSSLSQINIAANQSSLAGIQAQNEAKKTAAMTPIKTTAKGLGKVSMAGRMETNLQSIAHRELS